MVIKIFVFINFYLLFIISGVQLQKNFSDFKNENKSRFSEDVFLKNDNLGKLTKLDVEAGNSKIVAQREVAQTKPEDETNNVRLFLPPDMSVIINAMNNLEDEICKEHVLLTIHALNNRETWAMQMLDSSAKFPSGVLVGTFYQLGNYDECVAIKYKENEMEKIKGQYCLADVFPIDGLTSNINKQKKHQRTDESSTLHWAICVPHSCKPREVATILDFILNSAIGTPDTFAVNVSKNMCYYEHDTPFTTEELAYGYIIVAFLSVIFISTSYHVVMYYWRKNDKISSGLFMDVILSFSVVNNVNKMLTYGKSDLNLDCISGIKFLSMMLIICAHSLLFVSTGPVTNSEFLKQVVLKVENASFLNNPLLVDTYLLLSGFLMCRLLLLELEKRKGKVNVFILYIFRYIRLTPAYLVVLGFYCTWLIRLDQGPLWQSRISDERDRCVDSWWVNLLYVNNYINVDRMCMFQSWYLSVDTQLFMLAPLLIYPLWRWRKCGELLLGFTIVTSIIIPSVVTYIYDFDPTFMLFVPEIRDLFHNYYFINAYIKTHMRANSYCLGLAFGYLVHKLQSSDYKIPKISLLLGWLLSPLFLIASTFSVSIFYVPDFEYNNLEAAAYCTLHRVSWCLGVGWILVACITGNGGFIQKFLCWKPFLPLSRLTYSAYLVNGLIELHAHATIRQPRFMSNYHLASESLSHLLLTFSLAFVVCILFESPIHGLEKILIQKNKRSNNSDSNEA